MGLVNHEMRQLAASVELLQRVGEEFRFRNSLRCGEYELGAVLSTQNLLKLNFIDFTAIDDLDPELLHK